MAHYFLQGFLLPLLLLIVALLNWSLISLINLLCFLVVQFTNSRGFSTRRHAFVAWFIIIFSVISVLSEAIFHVIWAIEGEESSLPDAWWAKLIGFMRARSMIFPLAMQLLVAFITIISIYWYRFDLKSWKLSCWDHFSSSVEQLGSHLRVLCCLLLPVVELVVGISHPSFISLPFFICSCIALVDWSLTSNISGLFRWRKPLLMYASFYIVVLYAYQLPVQFPYMLQVTAEIIGLYKVSAVLEWPQICCGLSLLLFYIMLSTVRSDLEDMEFILSMKKSNLADQLLPLKDSFFVRESRSGIKHTNVLLRGAVFRTFSINFFTYGFPVSLFALSYWSMCFTSVFGLALLGYVGYILYAFPSLFHLHRLNGLLLIFILFWCFGTYVFNVMFTIFNKQTEKDIEIWETLGFWHYPIPGLYLLAQFCLGILVAVGNLVNDSVHIYQSNQDGTSCNGEYIAKDEEGTKVLIIATIAWGLRKSSRAITLTLIFLIAMKPGLIHAIYMVFFMVFLLSHTLSEKMLQSLILLCEVHFALLHILELDLVSRALEGKGSFSNDILAQIGFKDHASSLEFLQIAALLCFCAVYNHGFKLLSSFSAIVQHTPYSPVGFSIWRAGLDKSVLLSVYTYTEVKKDRLVHSPHERRIETYISVIGDAFLSAYRSCGTYVAFLTILVTVYLVKPNYISFGYLFFLLLWISGRQFIDRTRRCLWFPLKVYAILVFLFTYSLSNFASFRTWLSGMINLYHNLGYDQEASFLWNVGESLTVMIVMQLYSYERRKSKYSTSKDLDPSKSGVLNFMRRILIWHSEKLLSVAVFYASLSPVGASGFVYLLGLVICSTLPKASRVPSKVFLFYTGLLVIGEYIYQMWGDHFGMFPGQSHASLSLVLGLQVYNPGFWGLESGLRGKVLVIFACTLQYHTFHWLEKIPNAIVNRGKWEESCPLFVSAGDKLHSNSVFMGRSKPSETSSSLKQRDGTSNTRPSFDSVISQGSESVSNETQGSKRSGHDGNPVDDIWGSPKENHKWNKQRVSSLKRERFDLQKNALKVCLKFWMENMFRIFGLEINMIALLLASFVSLNAISLVYIAFLACCILLGRRILRKVWFIFVFSFASILFLEYFSLWRHQTPLNQHLPKDTKLRCHDCWGNSFFHSNYCKNCWLGFIIDDSQMLVSHFIVFMLACFKLRADHLDSFSESHSYRQMMSQRRNAFWTDLSFETKSMWTMFDYLRLYCYCHLLDIVIILILITGTLEYDILHIGYLGCALVFFRIRLQILKRRNKIFKYLRMYNFTLIVLSVAYQSPYLGNDNGGKCGKYDYIYEMIGFYKYDYGFRITSRSAFVEIIIFMLVSLQSSMFSSQDFDYVSRYLEAEQIGAIAREQEKKAAWKTAQLLHIRKSEDLKYQRNLQVEKIRSEMVNLQVQLSSMKSTVIGNRSQEEESLRWRRRASLDVVGRISIPDKKIENDLFSAFEMHGSPTSENTSPSSVESLRYTSNSLHEITEVIDKSPDGEITDSDRNQKELGKQKKQSLLVSAVRRIKDGVSQVQSIGNQGVANLMSFLDLSQKDLQVDEHPSTEIGINNERDGQKRNYGRVDRMSSVHSGNGMVVSESTILQIGRICSYMIQSNNDVVCYCCFVLIFLWNFSLLSMVYLAALFLYALCVYTGPSYMFWVIMLIYTEVYILLQYLYQIIIHHYVLDIHWELLHELGFPNHKITSSFVISSWPLFLVYLFTLLQNSITAADGEWDSLTQFEFFKGRHHYLEAIVGIRSWKEWIWKRLSLTTNFIKDVLKSFHWYWKSLTQGAESPPHFLQLSMEVKMWPGDGIQPERIESGINKLLNICSDRTDKETSPSLGSSAYRVRVQSIKRSQENLNLVLVVFEVVCAFPPPESPRTEWFKSLTPAADAAKEILEAQSAGVDGEIGFPYPILSVIGGGRREIDLYAYIFGADLTVFFLVAIFYHSIMKNSDQLLEVYQFDEQFPKEFVFILMVLFFLIVLDRIIYLCSFATGKVLFYLFNLVLFTYSVTKYAWNMEPSQKHAGALALRAIYLAKATSLALQAIQIRYGIPHKSTLYRQFLTSKVSRINFLGFKLYRVIPFLYELRCLLDWSCTLTSLTMYDWLKLEDIHSSLYLVKCDADLNRATHQHGQKQTNTTKCCNGICLFFILICVIWAPMLMYSSGNPTNIANPIKDANVQIDIKSAGGRLTLYQTTLCQIISLDDFHKRTGVILDPQGYLDAYNMHDTQLICCESGASVLWTVPPAIQARFATSIDADTSIVFSWVLTRARPKDKEVVKYEIVANPSNPLEVQAVFNGSTNGFRIYEFYPRYFRVTGSGDIHLLEQTAENVSGDLVMNRGNKEWWSFRDTNASDASGCGGPMAIVVSEETPQGILGETLSKFSIWGLYISFVLAVGRFIRLQCSDLRMKVPFENLPSCDRLIAICEDIYAARAEGELKIEEVLYWTLIKIYRSPRMLLEYTKSD